MNYYNQIKELLISNEVYKKVKDYSKNKNDLNTYYEAGKLIIDAQGGEARAKYGDSLIDKFSERLIAEVDKKYNTSTLKRARKFYLLVQKGATVWHQSITWSHVRELLKFDDINKINYYIDVVKNTNSGVRQLQQIIKSNEYERLPEETKEKLKNTEKLEIVDTIPNPIIIPNNTNIDKNNFKEKILKELILDNLDYFLKQLGEGFCYIGNEYKIIVGNNQNYIDLLLFNYKYNSFVVVELKVTELKKEHIGQIEVYMNYIDKNIKDINQNNTIGLIICKKDNKFILGYSSDSRIYSREYVLS